MDLDAASMKNEWFEDDEPSSPGPNQIVKDDKYFFDDGDCLFLAEGILFKLHKWSLCRDPESMFRGMFAIPQGPQDMTVLDPIPLSDSAEEFRALCWAVYALPNEIHRQITRDSLSPTRDANVKRLTDVAKMCHKYSLPAFESWALEMIRIQCQSPVHHLVRCTQEMLGQIMGLASLSIYYSRIELVFLVLDFGGQAPLGV
ncbi:BTB domain-containing protein [Mycena venus]|uniref:BTB domain-containing protein n=1 Tax=Mycena venus TaxID=2733690 RepID=A0A8H7D758_9AGAR|nr:BTB domain-containing protein [Mycena venus]